MTIDAEDSAKSVLTLVRDSGFQNELAQVRAKAVLTEILGEAPTYKWTYVAPRMVRNATAALLDLEGISLLEPGRIGEFTAASRQFALAWESLAKLTEKTTRESALMNAATMYELAGYQANAACIARQIVRNPGLIQSPNLTQLVAVFLQRLFLYVLQFDGSLRQQPSLEDTSVERLWEAAALALAADGLSAASRYFLSGSEDALADAEGLLKRSEHGFSVLGLALESNLARSMRSLLPVMKKRSLWAVLGELVPGDARWERYLKLLARGLGQDVFRSASVSELWPSQLAALDGGLLTTSANKVVRMPTSAGKTRVAEMAIAHTLVTQPGAKCIYVAPYRALVGELEGLFLNVFTDLGFRVSTIIGTYESDDFEQLLALNADVLVVTPEKLDLLFRLQPEFLDEVRLIILDEGQIVHDRTRGVKFELLLTRLKRRLPDTRFVFLSAVIPKETLEDFATWFNAQPSDILVSEWRPSIQRYAKMEWRGDTGVLRYSASEDTQLLSEFVPGIIEQRTYEFVNPVTGRVNRRRFPEPGHKGQTAAELAFKFAELGPVLVFCSQRNHVEAVGRAIQERLLHVERGGQPIPPYFRTENTRAALVSAEWLGKDHPTCQLLKTGIAIHHGGLPDTLRKAVESDFRERRYQIMVATNTLAQGVNLPIRTVVIHSCWRTSADGLRERISARDYWNIAGRAGRAREETEGTIIHLVAGDGDERDYQYFLERRKEVEPVDGALFQLLKSLVDGRLSEAALADALDPEVLALLAEEGISFVTDEISESVLGGTLVQTQAARTNLSTERLSRAFRIAGEAIAQTVPDPEYRSIYCTTGLKTQSCNALRSSIEQNAHAVRALVTNAGAGDTSELAQMFLDACLELEEMRPDREFAGSYVELLYRWLEGANMSELRTEFGGDTRSVEDLAKFIEDLYGYKLPWGISAYIRIATKVFDLPSESLSPFCRFFPSMVKFGVPFPEAAWAMAAGIPFRDVAIEVSSRYLRSRPSASYSAFFEWLGSLDIASLREEYGLKPPILEDVSRALLRSGANPLLSKFAGVDEQLPLETEVRGIAYESRRKVALRSQVQMAVKLVRDYDNPIDRNAVAVDLPWGTLGYLPRPVAQLLAPEMDTGGRFEGVIAGVEPGLVPRIRVRVAVQTQAALDPRST